MMNIRKLFHLLAGCVFLTITTACNGILGDLYDEVPPQKPLAQGKLVVDATRWNEWHYIDFERLRELAERKDTAALLKAQTEHEVRLIPTAPTGEARAMDAQNTSSESGIYTYWFDVLGKGVGYNAPRTFTPTEPQSEPATWSIAIHRNNVRTNGATVLETSYTSLDSLPMNSSAFMGAEFVADQWSENTVWVDQTQMLNCLIGSQGIATNPALSSWLRIDLPPIPPAFTPNHHVFIVRFANGKFAALQLENYISPEGTKCWLTLNYKYPY